MQSRVFHVSVAAQIFNQTGTRLSVSLSGDLKKWLSRLLGLALCLQPQYVCVCMYRYILWISLHQLLGILVSNGYFSLLSNFVACCIHLSGGFSVFLPVNWKDLVADLSGFFVAANELSVTVILTGMNVTTFYDGFQVLLHRVLGRLSDLSNLLLVSKFCMPWRTKRS